MTTSPPANNTLLYYFLGIGITLLAAVFIGMTALGSAPLIPAGDETAAVIAYALCGIAVAVAVVASLVLRPRVPDRTPGRSVEQYWADPAVLASAVRVWFLLEAAAVLSSIAFLVAGGPVAMLTMGATIVAYWITGPNVFAKP